MAAGWSGDVVFYYTAIPLGYMKHMRPDKQALRGHDVRGRWPRGVLLLLIRGRRQKASLLQLFGQAPQRAQRRAQEHV